MTADEARRQFDEALSRTTDPDARANIELAREYCCNPEFREKLADYIWNLLETRENASK